MRQKYSLGEAARRNQALNLRSGCNRLDQKQGGLTQIIYLRGG